MPLTDRTVMTLDVAGILIDLESGILAYVQARAAGRTPADRAILEACAAAEMVGWNKPDPQVFAFSRGRLSRDGFGLGDMLHVAQSQYHDIAVARRLGYHTFRIERRKGKAGTGATPTVQMVAIPN